MATLRDPSFTFVDALSVAAWGRLPSTASCQDIAIGNRQGGDPAKPSVRRITRPSISTVTFVTLPKA